MLKAEIIDGKKHCCGCDQWLPTTQFHRTSRLSTGFVSRCRTCRSTRKEGFIGDERSRKPFKDLAGRVFGRLTVREFGGKAPMPGTILWICDCSCGTETVTTSKQLLANHTQSCGCLGRERLLASGGHNRLPAGESAFNQYFSQYRRSAQARGLSFGLTVDEFREITSSDCFYCGVAPERPATCVRLSNGSYLCNGIDRVDNARGYERTNVRPCCKQCNIAKGTLPESEFITWLLRAAARFEHGESG